MFFTDDMEGAAAGARGATPSDFQTFDRGTRGSDGLLMLYAAGVGLPVLTPGPGLPAPSSSESFRLDCSTAVHAAAVVKQLKVNPLFPLVYTAGRLMCTAVAVPVPRRPLACPWTHRRRTTAPPAGQPTEEPLLAPATRPVGLPMERPMRSDEAVTVQQQPLLRWTTSRCRTASP